MEKAENYFLAAALGYCRLRRTAFYGDEMNNTQLKAETKHLKAIQVRINDIMKKEKALAKKRARRWLTKEENVELALHTHYMLFSMRQVKASLRKK